MTPGSTSSCPAALRSGVGSGQPCPCYCQHCPASHLCRYREGEEGERRRGEGRREGRWWSSRKRKLAKAGEMQESKRRSE